MLYLYGASGHGKVVAEIAEDQQIPLAGFIDNNKELDSILTYTVVHEIPKDAELIITIGNNRIRKEIVTNSSTQAFCTLVHSRAHVSKRSTLLEGTVVMAGVTIHVDVCIGKHCIINTNASVDHDCIVEDFVHISPNAALAGAVKVGEGTHIGIGASIIQGVKIGRWATIGAGAVILRDVPDYAVVVGNPGRILKFTNIV